MSLMENGVMHCAYEAAAKFYVGELTRKPCQYHLAQIDYVNSQQPIIAG